MAREARPGTGWHHRSSLGLDVTGMQIAPEISMVTQEKGSFLLTGLSLALASVALLGATACNPDGECGGECVRAVDCVETCGGEIVQSGCCPCPDGSFDSEECTAQGGGGSGGSTSSGGGSGGSFSGGGSGGSASGGGGSAGG